MSDAEVIIPFIPIDDGQDQFGIAWEVGTRGRSLVVRLGEDDHHEGVEVELTYSGRDRFSEAVARAVTPGQTAPAASS